jgi:hypothetical protein
MNTFSKWHSVAAMATLLATLAPAAHAASYNVSFSGVFDATAPTTAFSSPGASWSVSFDIDSNPVPMAGLPDGVLAGRHTTVPFTHFSYQLNGAASASAQYLTLYSTANEGGLSVFFSDVFLSDPIEYEALELFGPQIYSGPESSPSILTGAFPTFRADGRDSVQLASGGALYAQGASVIAIVPEPGTGLMLLTGALALGAVARRRIGRAAAC